MNIAVIFDATCPWTTGHHILEAFEKLGYSPKFYSPYHAPIKGHDYYLYVDSGHEYAITTPKDKTFFYAIDTYQNGLKLYTLMNTRLEWWKYVSTRISGVIEAFEYGVDWWKEINFPKILFIGMGINTDIYFKDPQPIISDVCFVGGGKDRRKYILDIISSKYTIYTPTVWGTELNRVANSCHCFLDIPPMEGDMLGQRFFEGMGTNVPMVTMDRSRLKGHDMDGVYLYNMSNLKDSLLSAVDSAKNHIAPINRSINRYKWEVLLRDKVIPFITNQNQINI